MTACCELSNSLNVFDIFVFWNSAMTSLVTGTNFLQFCGFQSAL